MRREGGELVRAHAAFRARALGLHRRDVDHVGQVLAEGAHVDLAGEHEAHHHGVLLDLAVDRGDHRRQRRLGVRQVELEQRVEREREPVLAVVGGDADQLGQVEDVAREGRLAGDPHPDRRLLGLAREHALRAHLLFRLARAPRQFVDDLARQPRRQAGPGIGQEIDVQPLGRGHRVDRHLAGERDAQALAVGIAAGGADIARRAGIELVDVDVDRALEGDDDDAVGDPHLRVDVLGEGEDEPREAVLHDRADLALDRLGAARARKAEREQDERGEQQRARARAPAVTRRLTQLTRYANFFHVSTTGQYAAVPPLCTPVVPD